MAKNPAKICWMILRAAKKAQGEQRNHGSSVLAKKKKKPRTPNSRILAPPLAGLTPRGNLPQEGKAKEGF